MKETPLVHEIIKTINQIPGVWAWRNSNGARGWRKFGKKGSADITGVLRGGKRLELEVKLPGNNNFEPDQPEFLERMAEMGAAVAVVRSVKEAVDMIFVERQRL